MPSRDANGRELSGNEKRKRGNERIKGELVAPGRDMDIDLDAPPEDTSQLVTWAASALAKVLHSAATENAFATKGEQLRFLSDGLAKIGMLRDKAAEQDKLRKLAEKHKLVKSTNPGSEGLEPFAGTVKPSTARRTRKS
jgi:hypothetical protein